MHYSTANLALQGTPQVVTIVLQVRTPSYRYPEWEVAHLAVKKRELLFERPLKQSPSLD